MADTKLISDLDEQILDRIRAVGLPNLVGPRTKVPLAKGFKVAQSTFFPDRVDVVLSWIEPTSVNQPIAGYLISVTGAVGNNQQPASPYSCDHSPAQISIPVTPGLTGLTFQLQTRLQNGFLSNIDISPTTGLQVVPGNQLNSTPSETLLTTNTYTANGVMDTYVIPANTPVQGSVYRYTAAGDYIFTAPGQLLDIRTYINGASSTATTMQDGPIVGVRGAWLFSYNLCFRSIGTSAQVATTTNMSAVDRVLSAGVPTAAVNTVDTTQPITIELRVAFVSTGQDIAQYIGYHEIFKDARF